MAIRVRRGLKEDFDPTKMLPGEWAVSIDNDTLSQMVWMCFTPGVTKRMGTYDDFKQQIAEATKEIKDEYIQEFQKVLDEIELLTENSNSNTDIVIQIRDDVENIYLPQMLEYLNNSEMAVRIAAEQAGISEDKAILTEKYAVMAESFTHGGTGVRENEAVDNAQYFLEQAKQISQSMNGLVPMGTIAFEDLSLTTNQVNKYMFNISNDFVTDETFKEGAGLSYPAGTNVFRTNDGYWDCLAGSFQTPNGDTKDNTTAFVQATTRKNIVSGEKHSIIFGKIAKYFSDLKEIAFSGSYNDLSDKPSASDVGAVAKGGNTADNTVTYASTDSAEATEWTDVEVLATGETHSSLFNKISTMFKNIRYLYKKFTELNSEKVGFPDYSNRKSFASGDTMTSDGYVRIGVRASENRFISITVNGVVAYMGGVIPLSGSSNYDMSPLIPVKAGDVVTYSTNVTEATGTQFGSVAHFFALRK